VAGTAMQLTGNTMPTCGIHKSQHHILPTALTICSNMGTHLQVTPV
jgi:hypothetical protein